MSAFESEESTRSPFSVDTTCENCGKSFDWRLSEGYSRTQCRNCQFPSAGGALVRQGDRSLSVKRSAKFENNREQIFSRLQELLVQSSEPYVPRAKTFSEWLFNEDPNAAERQARKFAGKQAQALMKARHDLLALLRDEAESERIVIEQQLESRLAVMRADVERLKLLRDADTHRSETEEIEAKRYVRRLEEAMKVKGLLEGPQTPERSNQAKQELDKIRRKFTDKVEVEQSVIEDFRRKLSYVYWSDDFDDEEKTLKIRSILDIYRLGREALPKEIRRFLDRVEKESAS